VVTDKVLDVWIPLDGVWRIASGQRLHLDFFSPLGDAYYALHALAGWWVGPLEPRLLLWVNALAGVLGLALGVWATRDRLPDVLRSLALAALALGALSPRTLDSAVAIGFNAMYNRWGWSLAGAAALVALLPPRRGPKALDGALVALLVVGAFWLKVTFLPTVVGLVALGILCWPEQRRTLGLGLLVGAALTLLSAWTTVGAAYRADLALAAAANAGGPGLIRVGRLAGVVEVNRPWVVAAVVLGIALIRTARGEAEAALGGRLAVATFALTAGGLVVASQNHDATVPLLGWAPLLAAAEWARRKDDRWAAPAAVLAAVALGWPASLDARVCWGHWALAGGPTLPASADPASPLFKVRIPDLRRGEPPPAGVGLVLDGTVPGSVYDNLSGIPWDVDTATVLDDAASLVRKHQLTERRMATLTFSQFLPLSFGAPPPRGLASWYDFQRTFNEAWPACERLADTEVVLVPEVWLIRRLREVHQPCLDAEFEAIDRSPLWTLYVRREPSGGR
jgi:hypothetical protein